MGTYLISNKNLGDLPDIIEARKHLGIGTIATQNSNDVFITGGSISISNFALNVAGVEAGNVLVATDEHGNMGWREPFFKEWTQYPQNEIDISNFVNDLGFVKDSQLSLVALSGNYNDLSNTPTNFSSFYDDTYYMRKVNNLSEISDKSKARSNLGLGEMSTQNKDNVEVGTLFVEKTICFGSDRANVGKYLMLNDSLKAVWRDIPLATHTNPGLITLSTNFLEDSKDTAPTSFALRNAYNDLKETITSTLGASIDEWIDNYGLLTSTKNLEEFADNKASIRRNLGMGNLAIQDSNLVHINNLNISNSVIFQNGAVEGKILKCGPLGEMVWSDFPLAIPPETSSKDPIEGIVKVSHFYTGNTELDNWTVPSYTAISNMFDTLSNNIVHAIEQIPTNINQLDGIDVFLRVERNLRGVQKDVARNNLGLHSVAHTGSYTNLINTPSNVSQFTNNRYLETTNNLTDLKDITSARRNLGLGNMALQDTNDVYILGGTAILDNLTVKKNFIFNDRTRTGNLQEHFLRTENNDGGVQWSKLPRATENLLGVVKLTHDLNATQTDSVPSATVVFREYHRLLERIKKMEESIDRITVLNALS
jgi:hypothetical protein